MEYNKIKELIDVLNESNLSEISIEDDEHKITLKKEQKQVEYVQQHSIQQPNENNQNLAKQEDSQIQINNNANEENNDEDSSAQYVTAPMVGTFYKAPSPEEGAYVEVGDRVTESSIVCILEAMKLFNEIQAEVSGEVIEILVEDGQMVEYNQPLFKVK
ncbi:acetyl-CoA carboxylase biotin carboxyl carrier protein [Abyssicoccus albus]|uniref:acetyl-CoA carboxylase biotin carboxyl carrier protein n=1 Tax=Abyssicoccus albus TaxID=1817405 RepID=UPI00097E2D3E|nr:acetyl-CoA carboxylase biotin carboxyl carrier protein [Abyssicoccus albus]AQL56105.1 acetyl-CoA carboxylase, biotin carboxyl carrier protein [Abyssicoccus albus]